MTPLVLSAASIGFLHTLAGPDHYVPFVALARARNWSIPKTILITVACGIGHVGSSVLLAVVGMAGGIAVFKLEALEAYRNGVAGWLLIAFGALYAGYGIRRKARGCTHTHWHSHADGTIHSHGHSHLHSEHQHVHDAAHGNRITPWVLFTIFLFGPCEPLIPLVFLPGLAGNHIGVITTVLVFGAVTLLTMTAMVLIMTFGSTALKVARFDGYGHIFAGIVILACGVAVKCGL